MPFYSEDQLEEQARREWANLNQDPGGFYEVWRVDIKEQALKAEAESDKLCQHCFDHPRLGHDAGQREGDGTPWHKSQHGTSTTLRQAHGAKVRQVIRELVTSATPARKKAQQDLDDRKAAEAQALEAQRKEHEAREAEKREVEKERFKVQARFHYTQQGGDPAQFEQDFPALWERHLADLALKGVAEDEANRARGAAYLRQNA